VRGDRDASGFADEALGTIEAQLTPPGDTTKAQELADKAGRVQALYASGADALDNAKGLFSMKQYVQARAECEASIENFDKGVLEGGKDLGQPSRDLLQRIRACIVKIEEQNARDAKAAQEAAARKVAEEKARRSVHSKFEFEIAAEGMEILPGSQQRGLKRVDRSLPLDFRPAFLSPQIPAQGYSYLEVELEEAGLAAMLGVTTGREVDAGSVACADRWTVSMLDGSVWQNDVELRPTGAEHKAKAGAPRYKGFSIRETMTSLVRALNVVQARRNRRLGYAKSSGGSAGDRVGLLIHRPEGTMQIFINGAKHPTVVRSIPTSGPLFFMAELLTDHQQIRIVPDAEPTSLTL